MRVLGMVLCLVLASVCEAATLTVNTTADDSNADDVMPGDGLCADAFGDCTLRAAIQEANALAGSDIIEFSVAGVIEVSDVQGALPFIDGTLTIDGYSAPGSRGPGRPLQGGNLPVVGIDGGFLTTGDGLRLLGSANGSQVLGLAITNFPHTGIQSFADFVIVQGCLVGLDLAQVAAPNATGIWIEGQSNIIGRFDNGSAIVGLANAISGNTGAGILVAGDDNLIGSNIIGLTAFQNEVRPNGSGILVDGSNNRIGDVSGGGVAYGNLIAGNDGLAISLRTTSPTPDNNNIRANHIGVDFSGNAIGTGQSGIRVDGVGNVIGGGLNGANFIGNVDVPVEVVDTATDSEILGNRIGLSSPVVGNSGDGIVNVGSDTLIASNSIINSQDNGIYSSGNGAIIVRNQVGVVIDAGSALDFGNGNFGIRVSGSDTIIGMDGDPNLIGFNANNGISLYAGADGAVVDSNEIGMTSGGQIMPNGGEGIFTLDADDGLIIGNRIGYHPDSGIRVSDDSLRMDISGNVMRSNTGPGIDLGSNGADTNDPGDGDDGPNNRQNSPELLSVELDDTVMPFQFQVTYRVDSDAGNSAYPITVEFYLADSATGGDGEWLIASETYTTPMATVSTGFARPAWADTGVLIALARDADGNASEFGNAVDAILLFRDDFESGP